MDYNEPYFWTSTINKWQHLLKDDDFKWIIIESLQWLCNKKLVAVYGFVIMPNHIHLIWEQLQKNGKENPKGSFEKFTAHQLRTKLMTKNENSLLTYKVPDRDREYLFW